MINYTIYCDGACSGNPGPGGYAFVVLLGNEPVLKVAGHKDKTTNNCMELTAVVRSIKHAQTLTKLKDIWLDIYSDSAYCVNAIDQGWVQIWKKNGWKTKADKDVKNRELWEELLEIQKNKRLKIKMHKVKGHSGNKFNELVDRAAKRAILNLNANCTK